MPQDARKIRRVGVKALIYFEVVSSLALAIGLAVGNLFLESLDESGTAPFSLSLTPLKNGENGENSELRCQCAT